MLQEVFKKLISVKFFHAKTVLVVGIRENSVILSEHNRSTLGMTPL